MGLYTTQIQQLYVAYFNRPGDVGGLQYWESVVAAQGGSTTAISAAFAASAEYKAAYANMSSTQVVNQVYMNLFGRPAEPSGLLYWSLLLDQKAITIDNVVTQIAGGAQGTDATAYNDKTAAAAAFTAALDTTDEILGYQGTEALQLAKNFISSVTDDATLASAIETAALAASVKSVTDAGNVVPGVAYELKSGIDTIAGGKGNDTITGENVTALDSIDGGAGGDTLTLTSTSAISTSATATVKNVEKATFVSTSTVTADASAWTGLNSMTVSSVGAATVKAATTAAVTATVTGQNANVSVTGGAAVVLTTTGTAGDITVSDAAGAVTVSNSGAHTGDITVDGAASTVTISNANTAAAVMGSIYVTGGTVVDVTQTAANAKNTTTNQGGVYVTGTAATTAVNVHNAKAVTASSTKAGVTVSAVEITDVNTASKTAAGTIKSAVVDGYSTVSFTGTGLTSLSLANGGGNVIINNSGLTTPTNKTLAVSMNGVTAGTLDDADIYTTLNVTTATANSALANITFGAAKALNVAGTKSLTLTSTAGLSALNTVVVSGSAGLKADLSGAKVTSVNSAATTGTTTVTIDASKATFTGGAGVDAVTVTAAAPTKAIALGAGDDSLNLSAAAATPTAAIDGGAGTDTLTMTATNAATASGDAKFAGIVANFETLALTGATNQTIDLDVLGKYSNVTTSGGNGLTLSNFASGGTFTLTGAGTAYTLANPLWTLVSNTQDVLNLALTDGSGAGVAFASTGITATGVETVNITVTDTQAEPTFDFNNSVTLLGNSAKTIVVKGNAGLTLTAADTALTSLDASGITDGAGFTFTSGALAAASTIKGSIEGTNLVNVSSATKAVTYTGGAGDDTVAVNAASANALTLGAGDNTVTGGASGNNTVTAGKGDDSVTLGSGNNNVTLGDGANTFTATNGNNTYIGGADVDTVTVGSGANTLTLGADDDVVLFTTAQLNVNSYSTILDAAAGDSISFADLGTETFASTKVTLQGTAVFQDYANAVIAAGGNASVNGAFGWFQFGGDTYLVQSRHDGSGNNASFVNGQDMIVKLTGLVDLSEASLGGNTLLLGGGA